MLINSIFILFYIIIYYFPVPLEMEILTREHFNRWYQLGPYYLSIITFEIPFQVSKNFILHIYLFIYSFWTEKKYYVRMTYVSIHRCSVAHNWEHHHDSDFTFLFFIQTTHQTFMDFLIVLYKFSVITIYSIWVVIIFNWRFFFYRRGCTSALVCICIKGFDPTE